MIWIWILVEIWFQVCPFMPPCLVTIIEFVAAYQDFFKTVIDYFHYINWFREAVASVPHFRKCSCIRLSGYVNWSNSKSGNKAVLLILCSIIDQYSLWHVRFRVILDIKIKVAWTGFLFMNKLIIIYDLACLIFIPNFLGSNLKYTSRFVCRSAMLFPL